MLLLKRFLSLVNLKEESILLKNMQNYQNSLSKYASTKEQHLGFEAAA